MISGTERVPEKGRRITVRRFRGQYSEGLLLPLSDFYPLATLAQKAEFGLANDRE